MKTLANIFETQRAGAWYTELLQSLFGTQLSIQSYCIRDYGEKTLEPCDLYLVNASAMPQQMAGGFTQQQVVFPRLTFYSHGVELLQKLPKGTAVLFVSRHMEMAMEAISDLLRLGVFGLECHPYAPESGAYPPCQVAVTMGLPELVPPEIERVIDLGPRVFQAATIVEIALKLGLRDVLESTAYRSYVERLAGGSYSLDCLSGIAFGTESKLESLLETLPQGIIGVDTDGVIFAYNGAAERMLGVRREQILGQLTQDITNLIPGGFFLRQEATPEKDPRILRFHHTDFSVSSAPIVKNGMEQGYFTMLQPFAEEERTQQKLRLQLLKRGYTTKYCFADIIGDCSEICRAKRIAEKMTATDASILLVGESGTGKELFAHSIHHDSPRREMPFVAINCAALPETLLESELFGYADGAFTGAKKGGKLGLFEYAHKGTLFLDEIEGMSPGLQVKLLRVLQEKEVMRVGGNEMIPVDVRIIAASNENIRKMVEHGVFRKDLYYRLNTLPVEIPPLRRRGSDILLLLEHIKRQIDADFMLTPEVEQLLLHYRWEGNVRELRNIVEYLKYMGSTVITAADLPEELRGGSRGEGQLAEFFAACGKKQEKGLFLLTTLKHAEESGLVPGRRQISTWAALQNLSFSEQEVRALVTQLTQSGFLHPLENRRGFVLSEKGRILLAELQPSG